MLKNAFHFANREDWIERVPDGYIRLLGFIIAVGPVLTVCGWFYFSGHLTGQVQPYSLSGDVAGEQTLLLQHVRKKDPVGDETEHATAI